MLQRCMVAADYAGMRSTEREEIKQLHTVARERTKRIKLECANGALSLANAPPCVAAALSLGEDACEKQPWLKNDARYHLGTIFAELNQVCADSVQVESLISSVRDVITLSHGKHRALHFMYHATRPSFSRKCVTMANAPVRCTHGPELCIRDRKITRVDPENLSPAVVWSHLRVEEPE